eukprot:Lithocolla_globosa_v1_NODE_2243_length_2092_cov_5.676485.p1 type:complete len:346 gc:universal NODE_2243_length_2092_cov_5.676485:156-1193(+)
MSIEMDATPLSEQLKLEIIDYQLLCKKNQDEIKKMASAAMGCGFFYLKNHRVDEEFLFQLAEDVFRLETQEKNQYNMGATGNYFGYKASGGHVIDENGTPDNTEVYNLSKDDIFQLAPQKHPPPIQPCRNRIRTFMTSAHGVALTILHLLTETFGLPDESLTSLHHIEQRSGDHVRLTLSTPSPKLASNPGSVILGEHTDFGSVTMLFNRAGGLQVKLPSTTTWKYVRPQQGYAVINLGDALVKLLGNRVHSGLHRVVIPPGTEAGLPRSSVVYFVRPNSQVPLSSLFPSDGESTKNAPTADEWISKRVRNMTTANYQGKEKNGSGFMLVHVWSTAFHTECYVLL